MKKLQKGFTLIELLVVIAIIGILSSVVLASLSSARTRGNDAAIQADLANMRAQAELYMSTMGNYGTTTTAVPAGTAQHCIDAGTIFRSGVGLQNALTGVAAKTGGTGGVGAAGSRVVCGSATNAAQTAWSVMASTSAGFWCVDSAGASKISTAIVGGLCN